MKICKKCLIILDTYNKHPNRRWSICNICYYKYLKNQNKNYKRIINTEYNKEYYKNNKEKEILRSKTYQKSEKFLNRDKIQEKINKREYQQERLKKDPIYKLRRTVSRRLRKAIKSNGWNKKNKTRDYIGCTLEELKLYLENQFKLGMTWENHGEWHIDHIIPLASAQTEEEIYKLSHYTNLQPLWAIDNLRKNAKIT